MRRIGLRQAVDDQVCTETVVDVTNDKMVNDAKLINHSVIYPSLDDLQYIDVVLSDESGKCSEVVRAVVDSGSEICVVKQDMISALDCMTLVRLYCVG